MKPLHKAIIFFYVECAVLYIFNVLEIANSKHQWLFDVKKWPENRRLEWFLLVVVFLILIPIETKGLTKKQNNEDT